MPSCKGVRAPALTRRAAQSGDTPLHLAAAAASPDAAACVAALMEAGADVHARDDQGRSPLLRFAKASPGPPSTAPDLTTASLLLARGASVNAAAQARRGACVRARARGALTPPPCGTRRTA